VLCVAVEVQRPYAGERIELRTSNPDGDRLSTIQLHPACYLPRPPFSPLPTMMYRQTNWKKRHELNYVVPYSMRLRVRVLQKEAKSWSAEFCVAFEALELPLGKPAVFNLSVSVPFSKANQPLATPPAQWEPLNAPWDPKADLFVTPKEDEVNEWAQGLFREGLDRARNLDPATPVLGAAFDQQMSTRKIEELLAINALELKIAPSRYHALWYRMHLLRRANRLKQADEAYRTLVARLPRAARLEPVVQERNSALITEHRFDEFEKENRGMPPKLADWIVGMRTAWELDTARREQDAKTPGPRLILETSRGRVEVALYRFEEEGYDKLLAGWLGSAKFADKEPEWVTGAVAAAWPGMAKAARFPKDKDTPQAWRGTAALLKDDTFILATGPVHITMDACAVGRIVKGMEHVDAMTASDRILSAKIVPAAVADGSGRDEGG